MGRLITERVKELRREIAKLTEENRKYLLGTKYGMLIYALSLFTIHHTPIRMTS
jgi:hypothetical protein